MQLVSTGHQSVDRELTASIDLDRRTRCRGDRAWFLTQFVEPDGELCVRRQRAVLNFDSSTNGRVGIRGGNTNAGYVLSFSDFNTAGLNNTVALDANNAEARLRRDVKRRGTGLQAADAKASIRAGTAPVAPSSTLKIGRAHV